MTEKLTIVIMGFMSIRSAIQPTEVAVKPMNIVKATYFNFVVLALKVHRALAKNENVTATQNAARFDAA